jgi:hypothetical protein
MKFKITHYKRLEMRLFIQHIDQHQISFLSLDDQTPCDPMYHLTRVKRL